ncbi:MATE family efflux transporter [Vibrio sp.]|nr:MATE family efflux transporter [Vibrio sp.]
MKEHHVKSFFRYMILTVAAMLVSGLYQIIDGAFIGHYVGSNGLGAINTVWSILSLIIGIGLMIGVGTGAVASIFRGQKNHYKATSTLANGFILIGLFSVVGALLLHFTFPTLVSLQTSDKDVIKLSHKYLNVIIWCLPFLIGSTAIPFFIRNDGKPVIATLLMLFGAAINIVLDYLLIGYFHMNMQGAAIATVIAQSVTSILGSLYFYSDRATLRLHFRDIKFSLTITLRIVAIGLSSLFMYLYWGVMVGLHNSQFSWYGGTTALGAYAVLGYFVTFYYLTIEGVANSLQPLASFHYGEEKLAPIRELLKISLCIVMLLGGTLYLLLYLFPGPLLSVFTGSDDNLFDVASQGAKIHLFALAFDGFLVVSAAFYQSVHCAKKAIAITIGNIIVQPPLLWLLPKWFALDGVWLAYPLSNIMLSLFVGALLLRDIPKILGPRF